MRKLNSEADSLQLLKLPTLKVRQATTRRDWALNLKFSKPKPSIFKERIPQLDTSVPQHSENEVSEGNYTLTRHCESLSFSEASRPHQVISKAGLDWQSSQSETQCLFLLLTNSQSIAQLRLATSLPSRLNRLRKSRARAVWTSRQMKPDFNHEAKLESNGEYGWTLSGRLKVQRICNAASTSCEVHP